MSNVEDMTWKLNWALEVYRQPGGCLEIRETADYGGMVHICNPWYIMRFLKDFLERTDIMRDKNWPGLSQNEQRGMG